MTEEERPFLDELLDVAVFAPIGALAGLASDFPAHVARGREEIERRVAAARVTGRFAVAIARKRFSALAAEPAPETVSEEEVVTSSRPVAATHDVPRASDLAIPDYDALAASQVVARLDGLHRNERELIRRYEEQTRARRTILGRLAQLDEDE